MKTSKTTMTAAEARAKAEAMADKAAKAQEKYVQALEKAQKLEALEAEKKAKKTSDGVTFEIVQHICDLSTASGWTTELNVVKWGDANPKYDVRAWNEDHTRMNRGITMTKSEICALVKGFVAFANDCK